jgi:hypothetical protein
VKHKTISTIVAEQGWNDTTLVGLLLQFIEEHDLKEAVGGFLSAQADNENEGNEDL